jgi:ribosomal protein S18 acetylase RimI-like enzyme
MPLKVRAMLSHDRPAIIKILQSTAAFTPADVEVAIELIDCYLADSINSGYHFWLADLDGHPAGYICYGPTPLTVGTWDIYWLATAPDLKGKGIGGSLLTFAEENITAADGRMILIETASNPLYLEARKFYLAHGYIIISSIPDFYSPGDNKITFRKLI